MPLSPEEKKQLEALTAKDKEPETVRGDIRWNIDLSDNAAVELAREIGILPKKQEQQEEQQQQEGTPDQGGYFGRRGNAA